MGSFPSFTSFQKGFSGVISALLKSLKSFLATVIHSYRRFLSPLFPPHCRFEPTCSLYALTAIEEWGICRGLWLTLRRVLRCHPLAAGGYDPVPRRQG